jgi:hypothetical protein
MMTSTIRTVEESTALIYYTITRGPLNRPCPAGNVSFAQEKFLSKNRAQVFAHPPAPFPEAGKGEIGEIGRRMG